MPRQLDIAARDTQAEAEAEAEAEAVSRKDLRRLKLQYFAIGIAFMATLAFLFT